MSEYQTGKDMANFERELQTMQVLLQQLYNIVEHNIHIGTLKEPKKKE